MRSSSIVGKQLKKEKPPRTTAPLVTSDEAEDFAQVKLPDFRGRNLEQRRRIALNYFGNHGCRGAHEIIPLALHYYSLYAMGGYQEHLTEHLQAVLARPIDFELLEPINRDKRLPSVLLDGLAMSYFLSRTLIPAWAAQRITGVPASILLAECVEQSGTEVDPDVENDFFRAGVRLLSAGASFLEHAVRLATDKTFEPVWLAKDDRAESLKQLKSCEFWDEDTRQNMIATIVSNHLQECDCC